MDISHRRLIVYLLLAVSLTVVSLTRFLFEGASGSRGRTVTLTGPSAKGAFKSSRERFLNQFDLSNSKIDLEDLYMGGMQVDGIVPLTRPARVGVGEANHLTDDRRVVVFETGGEAVGYPVTILRHHEIVHDSVGGKEILVTYCPLCDSAAVVDPEMEVEEDGETKQVKLAFGNTGMLYHSNMVMYDRVSGGLWSQVNPEVLTGRFAGRGLRYLPFRVERFGDFREGHPLGKVLSFATGYPRPYEKKATDGYFESDRLIMAVEYGDKLWIKTLGMGVSVGEKSWFVTQKRAQEGEVNVETEMGVVKIRANEAGMELLEVPDGVRAVQTFYFAWSSFYPETEILDR